MYTLNYLFQEAKEASTNYDKGHKFESFLIPLFETVPGVNFLRQDHHSATSEIDLIFGLDHNKNEELRKWTKMCDSFTVSAKNWKDTCPIEHIKSISSDILVRKHDFGVFVTASTLSPQAKKRIAQHFLTNNIRIPYLEKEDLKNILNGNLHPFEAIIRSIWEIQFKSI